MKKILYIVILSLFSYECFATDKCKPHPELDFFNTLGGKLEIELSEATKPINSDVYNEKATPSAAIKSIVMRGRIYEDEGFGIRDLSKKELDQIAFSESFIILKGSGKEPVKHESNNEKFFTVRELLKAVELTELKTRHKTDWFGGVDVHHIHFAGIKCQNGIWSIFWDS